MRCAVLPWLAILLLAACSRPSIPDPRAAATAYAEAAQRGDASAIYRMLSSNAQRNYGQEGVRKLVADTREELRQQGKALASEKTSSHTEAVVRYADGEQAELVLQGGVLKIDAVAALPAGARTPAEALDELRQGLARRSYSGLMRVLTSESRSALENDMRSLVDGLDRPETLEVKVKGDAAEVEVPGGHSVTLKREAGVWRVEDFD
jgi:hypothetical protein